MDSKKTPREIWQEELASRLPEFGCSNTLPFHMENTVFGDGYGTITVTGMEDPITNNHDFTLTFDLKEGNVNTDWFTLNYSTDLSVHTSTPDNEWSHFLTTVSQTDTIPTVDLTFEPDDVFWSFDEVEKDPQYQIDLDLIIEWLNSHENI